MLRFRRMRALLLACLASAACLVGADTAVAAAPATALATAPTEQRPVIGAYYAGWNSEAYPVSQIPADQITHLFYAFSTIDQGKCTILPNAAQDFADLAELKREHPQLRTLISIGGWGTAGFSDAALTAASRQTFVSSCLDMFFSTYRGSFDGVDLDWEFPVYGGPTEITDRPEDRRNMTLLAQEFRTEIDKRGQEDGKRYEVTAALPTGRLQTDGAYDPAKSFELGKLAKILDFINLMTYDMGTGFSPVSTFNAPMGPVSADPTAQPDKTWNNVTGAVAYYRLHGVPANRLVLGTPFYGRGFVVNEEGDNHGLYQPYESTFWVSGWRSIEPLLDDPAWQRYWNPQAQSPWLYNAAERRFVSYEDPTSIAIRARYAKQSGLLGTFMWELSDDDAEHSMLTAMSAPFQLK
ncbi:glycoside hydrolase family 18 protein [Streptomyces sp. NPDC005808]|uniref:glycoside hydrolase family 18 protein n=1 Tax=Streptomyces sp. NPDC005808 TaxID=3364734 RepID=UPI0036CDBAAD